MCNSIFSPYLAVKNENPFDSYSELWYEKKEFFIPAEEKNKKKKVSFDPVSGGRNELRITLTLVVKGIKCVTQQGTI